MSQRIACLWFPNWAIQRRVVSQPDLRKQRVVLVERDARRGQLVAAASPLAMRAGVSVAMPLVEAKSLLQGQVQEAVPSSLSHFLPHQSDEDLACLEALADSLESHSPIVGLESFDELRPAKKHSPESIFLDVTGLAHLFGDEHQLAELAAKHCQQAGYLVRVAIANTLGQAWAVAQYGRQQSPVVLPPSQIQNVTRDLPVESLRLPVEMLETLDQLGIHTIGQLERLPRSELAMRFGHAIGLRLDQLNGVMDEPVIARRLPSEFQRYQSLDFPTRHRETIEAIGARLVQELCEQLRACQRGGLQWRFVLGQVEGESIEFTIRLFRATGTPADVLPLLAMHLEQALQPHTLRARKKRVRHRSPSTPDSGHRKPNTENQEPESSVQVIRAMSIDIQDVTVEVVSSTLLAQHQRRLFDENPHADPQAVTALINRLTSRIGASNVVCAKLQANAQPEYSFRLQPLVDVRQRRAIRVKKGSHRFARPLRLFHPPRELQATSNSQTGGSFTNTNISRPPALLAYTPSGDESSHLAPGLAPEKITRVWGPERIETGWWRGHTTCRDYWRVETEAGNHLWVFRDLRRRKWFVQGEF